MKRKLEDILIPFILVMILNLGNFILNANQVYGNGLNPHTGLLFASGLLLGPYGALGAVLGNIVSDFIKGYPVETLILRSIVGFGVSYLSYKLWYTKFSDDNLYPPRLVNSSNLAKFIGIIILTGMIYSVSMDALVRAFHPSILNIITHIDIKYFLNYVNFSLICGIIGIWIARKVNYMRIPEIDSKNPKNLFYKIILIIMIILTIIFAIDGYLVKESISLIVLLFISLLSFVFIYLTKPITSKIIIPIKTTHERIMDIFLLISIIIIIGGFIYINVMDNSLNINVMTSEFVWNLILSADIILLIFFIPSGIVLNYIEKRLIYPINSFSKIEEFIHEGEKIETEGLLDIYSPYTDEESEIGRLARSYSNLIDYNNHYIENIKEIETEKEKMKAELDIARHIQQGNLPTEPIKNEFYKIFGYSKPAKEVGGDFYDYFEIDDENLAIIIGDASGKGVPAALLTTTTQTLVRELLAHEKDPSLILYSINNHICLHNSESMFITLWLGIYNKNTNILSFSNAGHNPPMIKKDDKFELMDIDAGLVLGIMEDYEYITEEIEFEDEIVLYTDGITEAINKNEKMYGEKRLIDFFNKNASNENIIKGILKNINKFTQDAEQFDDMTLLILKKK